MEPKSPKDHPCPRLPSPTTTVCDTTTSIQPVTDSPIHVTDVCRQIDLKTAASEGSRNSPTQKDINYDNLRYPSSIYNKNFVSDGKSDLCLSQHIPERQIIQECYSSSSARKRSNDTIIHKHSNENCKRKKSTEDILTKGSNVSKSDNLLENGILYDRYHHFSDNEGDVNGFKFETYDRKYFLEDHTTTPSRNDEMGVMGSRSTVPEEVRLRINSRERQRMHDLNSALDSLRQVMPYSSGPSVKKLSKMSTLLLARNYIVMLTRSLEEMKRLVQELSVSARPKPLPTTSLLHDSTYYASLLANHTSSPTGLYLPPPLLHHTPALHCVTSTGTLSCGCVECQRKTLLAASTLESKKRTS